MMKKEHADHLYQAISLIAAVDIDLETGQAEPCTCCGLKKAKAWPELLIHKELEGTINKLTRLAASFEREGVK